MAYRNPGFSYHHLFRDDFDPSTNVTSTAATSAGQPLDYSYDDLTGPLTVWPFSSDTRRVVYDGGTGTPLAVSRLLIPPGHSLDGVAITVEQDTDAGFPSPTQLGTVVHSGFGTVDLALTPRTERYVRINLNPPDSRVVQVGELILTHRYTLERGPAPGWDAPPLDNALLYVSPAGVASSRVRGPNRQRYRMTWHGIASGSTDSQVLDDMFRVVGTHSTFFFLPPDTNQFERQMRLVAPPDIRQDFANPSKGISYRYTLAMEEAIG